MDWSNTQKPFPSSSIKAFFQPPQNILSSWSQYWRGKWRTSFPLAFVFSVSSMSCVPTAAQMPISCFGVFGGLFVASSFVDWHHASLSWLYVSVTYHISPYFVRQFAPLYSRVSWDQTHSVCGWFRFYTFHDDKLCCVVRKSHMPTCSRRVNKLLCSIVSFSPIYITSHMFNVYPTYVVCGVCRHTCSSILHLFRFCLCSHDHQTTINDGTRHWWCC